ncbi:peroxisomal acyl-coenzyme A oxidase 1-like isoform X2 [Xenia sp. Carnegie-2017]|uniref:peroxisomal acyl-coenzyme A oxidase 1-like isoform X2 n=1 Tax=Xenia sp. Carnegie-2017 TaxID=2897299 RepID=UPI001F04EBBB|nr:peroxisomal acyl-coenzyme A oxidase 1-like isoform X2 [Xenia sp. Carnegie-2017]
MSMVIQVAPFALHRSMFTTMIKNQSTSEQLKKWMPLIEKYQIIGSYAQTELGHGTNVRALETTATYNPSTETFILHSPTLMSTKWWPGSIGHTATHVILMARLITTGKDHGIHPFVVQIRSLEDHSVLPGIKLGHIGPKMGYATIDNGFLCFNHVHIPRENMLMKYNKVSPNGIYVKAKGYNEKLSYLSMVMIRAYLVFDAGFFLSRSCTIAIRYSAIRRQGKINKRGPESKILDYKTQQYALLPVLATSYAFWLTGLKVFQLYLKVQMEITQQCFDNAQELHATCAGMKAFSSQVAANGSEICRFRCGGHGFSMSSGLPSIYANVLAPMCTYEGDNIVMMLQTARYLTKCSSKLMSGEKISTPAAEYLTSFTGATRCTVTSPDEFRNPKMLMRIFKHRAARLVLAVSKKHQRILSSGVSPGEAWNRCSVDLVRAAKAHCHQFVVEQFASTIENGNFSDELRPVMDALFFLYSLHGIVEEAKDFLKDGFLSDDQLEMASDVLMEILDEIRPNAICLVDAFIHSDHALNSVIGRYDGNVYENMMKWAESFPLNERPVLPAYEKYLRPLLKGELASKL